MSKDTERKSRNFLQVKVGTIVGFDNLASYYLTDHYEVKELRRIGTVEGEMLGWVLTSANDVERWVGPGQWDSSGGYIISQPNEDATYDRDAYMSREHVSLGAAITKQKSSIRTREEIETELQKLFTHGVRGPNAAWPIVHRIFDEVRAYASAEERASERARAAALTRAEKFLRSNAEAEERLPDRDDVKKWQEDRSEFFTATILEIVCEYAAWRDGKDAEGQEPFAYVSQEDANSPKNAQGLEQFGEYCDKKYEYFQVPLYTRPANVAALEARGKELEAEKKQAFNQGYLIACCNLTNLHDEPSVACDVLAECSLTEDDVQSAELSEYDAEALSKIRKARGGRDPIRAALTREGGV